MNTRGLKKSIRGSEMVRTIPGRGRAGVFLLFAVVLMFFAWVSSGRVYADGNCSLNIDFGPYFRANTAKELYQTHPVKIGLFKVGKYENEKFSMDEEFSAADFINRGVDVDAAVAAAETILGNLPNYPPDYEEPAVDGVASFTGMEPGVYFGKVTDAPSEFKSSCFFVTLETSINMDISAKWSLVTTSKIEKKWNDDEDRDGGRPVEIYAQLYQEFTQDDGSVSRTTIGKPEKLTAPDWASEIITDLPKFVDKQSRDKVYRYFWREVDADGEIISEFTAEAAGEDNKTRPVHYTVDKPVDSNVDKYDSDTSNCWITTITNTHIPETIVLKVKKIWEDDDNNDNKRPKSIKATLLADGKPADKTVFVSPGEAQSEYELSDANNWFSETKELYVYRHGKGAEANGQKIEYSWSEPEITDYSLVKSRYDEKDPTRWIFENKHTPGETSAKVHKIWKDGKNQDGLRTDSVTVHLLQNGKEYDSVILNAKNGWTEIITHLPEYTDKKKNEYTWKEDPVPGYDAPVTTASGTTTTIVNPHTPDEVEESITKKWDDDNNHDGVRPKSIKVRLTGSTKNNPSVVVRTVTLTAENKWKATVKNLPRCSNGEEITYVWEEIGTIPGYTSDPAVRDEKKRSTVITNHYAPKTRTIKVKKVWKDEDNAKKLRPSYITVELLANGKTKDKQRLNADNSWSYTWSDLPIREEGKKGDIEYTVLETDDLLESGYEVTYSGSMEKGFVITNALTGSLKITKHVTVNGAATTTTSADGTYNFTVTGLDDYSYKVSISIVNGKSNSVTIDDLTPGTYTVKETVPSGMTLTTQNDQKLKVEAGKDANVSVATFVNNINKTNPGSGTTTPSGGTTPSTTPQKVTTTPSDGKVAVNGQKIWEDQSNAHKTRPESITIHLLANGTDTGKTPNWTNKEGNTWTYSFDNLPEKDKNGNAIKYTVAEDEVAGYKGTANGAVFVNKLIPRTPEKYININGVKTWADNGNEAGLRPNYITVQLVRNGITVESRTVSAGTAWNYTFEHLPADDGYGNVYTYFVREAGVPGYYSTTKGFNLINSLIPRKPVKPFEEYTAEELEDLLDLYDYDTPTYGGLLGTGDTIPVYPFIFGAIGIIAIAILFLFGRDSRKKENGGRR